MKKFSKYWIRSRKPKKQKKYAANAPLHIKQKFVGSHLSKELREKYKTRSVALRKGDDIKIVVGQFKGKTGKVDRVDVKRARAYISGVDFIKKEGTKTFYPIHPSNLIITKLNMEDKKRLKSKKSTVNGH